MTYDSDEDNKAKKLSNVSSMAQQLKLKKATVPKVALSSLEWSANKRQIVICTRTHSQMIQLVNELKKCSKFANRVSIVSLTSRKGLCVHPSIKKVESVQLLTEKCEDLTEKSKCPYNDQDLTSILSTNLLTAATDIEELGS